MKRLLVLLVSLGLLAAACGSDSAETDTGAGDDTDVVASEAVDEDTDEPAGEEDDSEADDSTGADGDGDAEAAGDDSSDGDGDGGGEALSASELDDLLAATAEQTSGRFEATMEMTGAPASELSVPLTVAFSGSFDNAADASDILIDMSGIVEAALAAEGEGADDPEAAAGLAMMSSFFSEPMQMRTIGDRSWVKWGMLAMFGAGDKWLEGEAEDGSVTQDFGFDANGPGDLLGDLADSGHSVELVGEDEIRGVTAAHYRTELDPEAMTPEQRAAFGDDLPEKGTYVLHVWVADDLVHRFQVEITNLEQTAENDLESMNMVYDLFDHGADVEITAPSPDEVVTEAELGFDLDDLNPTDG